MKKYIAIIIMILLLCSCSEKDNPKDHVPKIKEEVKDNQQVVDDTPKYVDDNNIVIGLYDRNGNSLSLYKSFETRVQVKKDINTFQAFFSNDETVSYSGRYAEYYYQKFNEVNPEKKYKVGFNLSYELNDGTKISQNIFGPSTTQTNYDYIEVYLYDAYKHRNDSFYSHIEENEYNDDTFITSIKLTAGSKYNDIKSRITLTVFTYDDDDFDEETKEYRGNSKYSILISDLNKNYE